MGAPGGGEDHKGKNKRSNNPRRKGGPSVRKIRGCRKSLIGDRIIGNWIKGFEKVILVY